METLDPDEMHRHRVYGKHRGTVTDNEDEDQLGQIEVTVPSVLGKDVKVWARPCFASGHFFVPPVGASVWIEFEAGDPGYPLWVGTWYPNGSVPPEASGPAHHHRVVHTPSGHVIELSDAAQNEKVLVRHKINGFISIDKSGTVVVANHKGANLTLDADQATVSLTSQQGHTVTMTAKGVIVAAKAGKTVVTVEDDQVVVASSTKISVLAPQVAISGGSISLGTGPLAGTMLNGDYMYGLFASHIHPTAMGPSFPPIPTPPPAVSPVPPPPPLGVTSIKVQGGT